MGASSEQGFAGSMQNLVPVYTLRFQFLGLQRRQVGDLAQISTKNSPKHIPLSVRQQEMGGTFRLGQLTNKECDELSCVPSDFSVEVPTPSTCDCDPSGGKVFKEVIKLK